MKWGSKRPFLILLVSMLLVALLPLLLNNLFYLRVRSAMLEQQASITEESMRFSIRQIDSIQERLILQSTGLETDLRNASVPLADQMDASSRMEIFQLSAVLRQELRENQDIDSIYLFLEDSESAVGTLGSYDRESLWKKFYEPLGVSRQAMDEIHRTASRGRMLPLGDGTAVFTYTVSRSGGYLPEKQLVFLLRPGIFQRIIDEVNPDGGILLLTNNKSGVVLAESNKADAELSEEFLAAVLGEEENVELQFQGEPALLRIVKSAGGCRMTAVIPSFRLLEANRKLQGYYWVILAASAALGLALAVFFSRRNMIPLNQLISYIQEHFGTDHPDSKGLEQIKDAVDALLEQQNANREQLAHYESLAILNDLRESFRGSAHQEKAFQMPPGCRYAVVRFSDPQADLETVDREIYASLQALPGDCVCYSLLLDNGVVEILGMVSPDFDERKVKELLTVQIDWLDQRGVLTVSAAFSQIYEDPENLQRAYEEACVTAVMAPFDGEDVIVGFSASSLRVNQLLRDYHHLDKQLRFSSLIAEDRFEEAARALPSLFPAEYLEEFFSESDISSFHLASLKYQFLHDLNLIQGMESLDDKTYNSLLQEIIYCKNHRKLYQLMERLCTDLSDEADKAGSTDEKSIDKIERYIRKNYTDPQLSVSSIAEAFGLSANSLSQMFSRKSDHGVLDYIHETRMKKAAELLLSHRELTIQSVAEQTGYTNILTFNRKFKAYYGQTAGEYRKRENQ